MTSAPHAEGRQFDPRQVYVPSAPLADSAAPCRCIGHVYTCMLLACARTRARAAACHARSLRCASLEWVVWRFRRTGWRASVPPALWRVLRQPGFLGAGGSALAGHIRASSSSAWYGEMGCVCVCVCGCRRCLIEECTVRPNGWLTCFAPPERPSHDVRHCCGRRCGRCRAPAMRAWTAPRKQFTDTCGI